MRIILYRLCVWGNLAGWSIITSSLWEHVEYVLCFDIHRPCLGGKKKTKLNSGFQMISVNQILAAVHALEKKMQWLVRYYANRQTWLTLLDVL